MLLPAGWEGVRPQHSKTWLSAVCGEVCLMLLVRSCWGSSKIQLG